MTEVKEMVLNKFGTIEVSRGNKNERMKLFCPYRKYKDPKTGREQLSFCGQECALFGQPNYYDGQVILYVCHNEFCCNQENFQDNRE